MVIPYYRRFLERFPDVAAWRRPARRPWLQAWAGLGYWQPGPQPSIVAPGRSWPTTVGAFPASAAALRPRSASAAHGQAIAAFAWGRAGGHSRRQRQAGASRHFGWRAGLRRRRSFEPCGAGPNPLLPAADCGAYTQGLMDLGATLCIAPA